MKNNLISDDSEALQTYLKNISSSKPLSAEEEKEAADKGDWQKLVNANLKFVVSVAKRFQNKGLPLSDLICEGNIGLIHSAKKFSSDFGTKFITYAVWHIAESIRKALHYKSETIRVPVSQKLTRNKALKVINEYQQTENRPPSDEELMESTGKNMKQINGALNAQKVCISLNTTYGKEDDSENTLVDIIANSNSTPSDDNIKLEQRNKILRKALEILNNKEHDTIVLNFGFLGQEYSCEYIANMFDYTPERVRQIRKSALTKLRKLPVLKYI